MNSPFRISVINDELGQDFGRACEVISREFGLEWIELRGMWNKNILKLHVGQVADRYHCQVWELSSEVTIALPAPED